MQKALKNNAVQWLIAVAASYITILGTLYFNDWVYWMFASSNVMLVYWASLCWLYRQAFQRLNVRLWWVTLAGGVILSVFQAAGDKLMAGFDFSWFLIRTAGYIPLFLSGLALIFSFAEKRSRAPAGQPRGGIWARLEGLFSSSRKSLLVMAGLLLACWLPYYIINWPGLVSLDIKVQMAMWQGFLPFTSHHPVLHTAFVGLFVQLGQLLGNDAVGVGIGTLIQVAGMALAVSCALRQMARLGVGLGWRVGVFLFYGLFPVFGWYATTLWKDIWLSAFALLFYLVLLEICRTKRDFFRSGGNIARLAVSAAGLILSKNNGIYLFLIALAVLLITQKGCRKQLLAGLLAGVALFLVLEGPVYQAMGVEKGDIREALSIPMLQIAKVVATDPGSISAEDKALIEAIMPYDDLPELYNPAVSDNIKSQFNSRPLKEEPLQYLGLWVRLGLDSPVIYVNSFLEQTYGYWYPEVLYWIFIDEAYTTLDPDGDYETIEPVEATWMGRVRQSWGGAIQRARLIPGVSILFSVGFAFWLLLAAALYAFYTRRWEILAPMALFFGVWLTCMASPVYAEYRYAYPAILCVPTVLGLTFGTKAQPSPQKR